MSLSEFIRAMPKVELHVHHQGSTTPEALLTLARKHNIALPADTVEGIRAWYNFKDFPHFIQIYMKICECIRTPEDIEWLTRLFLEGQAAQNIRYTEFTYTPHLHYKLAGIAGADQLNALNRAREWALAEHGVQSGIILDISRNVTPEEGLWTADLAIAGLGNGVVALGLGGPEVGHPPSKHAESFRRAQAAGQICILHAGETMGPESIWGALEQGSIRIGHGVRCLEDPALVQHLRERQTPLEVCPTSNVCLHVAPSFAAHPLPRLLQEGLYVTLNSDDPPMFNVTLTKEYLKAADIWGLDAHALTGLVLNGVRAACLPESERLQMENTFRAAFATLMDEYGVQ
jgi:adenosine deaminase